MIYQHWILAFKLCEVWDVTFSLADHNTMTPDELARQCFRGDRTGPFHPKCVASLALRCFAARSLVEEMEVEVKRLTNLWLDWFREKHSAPQTIRIDFMISSNGSTGSNGSKSSGFRVHTCELTECGGATCGLEVTPRTVAVVNESVAGAIEGFPKPLPPFAKEAPSLPPNHRGKERTDQKRPQVSNEVPANRPPRFAYVAIFYAILGMLWPRLRKLGNAHKNPILMVVLPLLYKTSLGGIVLWAARDKLRSLDKSTS